MDTLSYLEKMPTLAHKMLKQRGHDLIDDLMKKGVDRQEVYKRLARRVHMRPFDCHFSKVSDLPTLNLMVKELDKMVNGPQKMPTMQDKTEAYDYGRIFNDKKVLQDVGRRNAERLQHKIEPWYKRILHAIFSA